MSMTRREMLDETYRARQKAEGLLKGLLDAQAEAERQMSAQRRTDLVKSVTGRSAMENAIASTRRMIEALDRAIEIASKAAAEDAGLEMLDEPATGPEVVVKPHSARQAM